jgi:hypothetical protein
MTTEYAEIANAATLRVLVRLYNRRNPLPIDIWWSSAIDSEMQRAFPYYEDEDLRRADDTIKRLYDAGIITGEHTTVPRYASSPNLLIKDAALSTRAVQVLELVDSDCGGIVGDQAKIALMDANSRAIRLIAERLAGFLLA